MGANNNTGIIFTSYSARDNKRNFVQKPGLLCLTLLTKGKAKIKIGSEYAELAAPCIFLSSWECGIELTDSRQLTAKSMYFYPSLINKSFTPERLAKPDFREIADLHDYSLVKPFLPKWGSIICPMPQISLQITEWFDLASKEAKIKSSETWPCRVRRCLMQILFLLDDNKQHDPSALTEKQIADIVAGYIHTHYANEISLDSLCRLVYVNRTSLTRIFKARTRRSPIDYLLHYRLNIACELLTNSRLSICKIAETTGFRYESYFTRQFKAKIGLTPTQYRCADGFEILNIKETRIVEEF
ncbi:MAG: AraC family transcriptional regulator [Defluviitaleaceae bacterium]|nr:AraC family transcriptional regulator [Defluviitaleaceae bacterium]